MARAVIDGAILECQIFQKQQQQRLLNVFHYRLNNAAGAAVDGDDVTDLLTTFFNVTAPTIPNTFKNANATTWFYEGIRMQWIWPTRYTFVQTGVGQGFGANDSPALPVNVQATIVKNGDVADRHNLGAMRIGGLTTDDVVDSSVTILRQTMMFAVAAKLMTIVDVSAVPNALTLNPIIYNRAAPALSQKWTAAGVMTTSRVIRRRTLGVGI